MFTNTETRRYQLKCAVVGGKGKGLIFRKGKIVHTVKEDLLKPMFKQELEALKEEYAELV